MVAAVDVVTAGVLERMAKPTERVVHQAGRDFNTEEAVRFIYLFIHLICYLFIDFSFLLYHFLFFSIFNIYVDFLSFMPLQ